VAKQQLLAGKPTIIDRCNVSLYQRMPFLQLAAQTHSRVVCVVFDQISPEICIPRIVQRTHHETIEPGNENKARGIVYEMYKQWVIPVKEEGIHQIIHLPQDYNIDEILNQ
jgi:predicted kinase